MPTAGGASSSPRVEGCLLRTGTFAPGPSGEVSAFRQWAAGRRFPQLLLLTLALLLADVLVLDVIPFIDEVLLALAALLLGSLRNRSSSEEAERPPAKDVTERGSDSTRPRSS